MSDLFRSALGYLSGSQGDRGNDFVGQTVELGDEKLRVKRVIAEGRRFSMIKLTTKMWKTHEHKNYSNNPFASYSLLE